MSRFSPFSNSIVLMPYAALQSRHASITANKALKICRTGAGVFCGISHLPFAKFMNDQDFQKIVRAHLLREVYTEIREDDAAEPAA